jgi:saccharopine dehydrogenase-like NADP-dependent oxidoreductase
VGSSAGAFEGPSARGALERTEAVKALVVGATGIQGRRTATELARSEAVDKLALAGRDGDRLSEMADLLGGRVEMATILLDSSDAAQVAEACAQVDVIVSCAGPAHLTEPACIKGALAAGTPCVTLGDDHSTTQSIAALNESAVDSKTTVVSGCGLSPGLTNLLAVYAGRELEEIIEIQIAVACSLRDHLGSAMVRNLLRAFSDDARYVSEWRDLSSRAGGLPELAYFPEPVGWVETFNCSHPEVVTLRRRFPDIRSLRYRTGLTERAGMDAIRGPAALRLARSDAARRVWARVLRAIEPAISSLPPRSPQWTGARVDVRGRVDGRSATITLGIADHLSNLVSATVVHAALELGSRRVERPGINAPEDALDSAALLSFLYGRGMRVGRLTPELSEGSRA